MNKIATLAKIANRLDSLGLTKEADVLDSFIRKVAEDTETFVPKGQKYLDTLGGWPNKYKSFDELIEEKGMSFADLVFHLAIIFEPENRGKYNKDLYNTGYYIGLTPQGSQLSLDGVLSYLMSRINPPITDITSMIKLFEGSSQGSHTEFEVAFKTGKADRIAYKKYLNDWRAARNDAYNSNIAATKAAEVVAAAEAAAEVERKTPATGWEEYVSKTTAAGGDGAGLKKAWGIFAAAASAAGVTGYTPNFYSFVKWWKQTPGNHYGVKASITALTQQTAVFEAKAKAAAQAKTDSEQIIALKGVTNADRAAQ